MPLALLPFSRSLILVLLGVSLAACGSSSVESGEPDLAGTPAEAAAAETPERPLSCPSLEAVEKAREITRYRPIGRDLTDILFKARLADMEGSCEYEGDVAVAELRLTFVAERGPANQDGKADFFYFVALVDREGQVLSRQRFDNVLEFSENRTRAGSLEELEQRIALPPGKQGADYTLYVGIDLGAEPAAAQPQAQ